MKGRRRNLPKYNPPHEKNFMSKDRYNKFLKDMEKYKLKRKRKVKGIKQPNINFRKYMTASEQKRYLEKLAEYNKKYRERI